jgi:hypothetical protein
LNDALLVLACVLPVWLAARASYSRRGLEVNHLLLFSVGFVFYWVFPVLLSRLRVLADDPGIRYWFAFVDGAVDQGEVRTFLACALLLYSAFALGARLGGRLSMAGFARAAPVLPFAPWLLALLVAPAAGMAALFAWQLRSQLFAGYSQFELADNTARGPLSAATLVLLSLLLLQRAHEGSGPRPRAWSTYLYLLAYLVPAVLLLSAGGRLYVVTAALIWLTFRTSFEARLPLRRGLALIALALVASGMIGVVRSNGRLSALALAANIFSEPLFTSFSMLDFVGRGNFPLWNFPRFLLGDLTNLIPSAVFPGKGALLVRPEEYGYVVYAPVGAVSAFFSLMINFGVLGSTAVLFALGLGLSFLKRFEAPVVRVVYAMTSGWLALAFFRDPFSIVLVKNMLEFSVLVPIGIAAALHVATVAAGQPRRAAVAPAPAGDA